MQAPRPISGALTLVLCAVGFFGGWTLASVPLTATAADFSSLWIAAVTGFCGVGLMLAMQRALAPVLLKGGGISDTSFVWPTGMAWIGWAALLGLFAVSALYFIVSSNAAPIWAATIAICLVSLFVSKAPDTPARTDNNDASSHTGLILLSLIAMTIFLYLIILRPDADDAFYLNLPMGLMTSSDGMMATDTMYGIADWPLLGSNYRVESLPTLIAALSYVTGAPVVYIAHLVLPVIWCVVWVSLLAVIGFALFHQRWWVFCLLSILASASIAGTLQNWGVHGISRLFHGKGPLLLIVIPFILFVTSRLDTARFGFWQSAVVLTLAQAAALGLTANAIYLAPLALGLALLSGWIARGFADGWRILLGFCAFPPVLAGLYLLVFDPPVSVQGPAQATPNASQPLRDLAFWELSHSKFGIGLLFLLFLAAAICARVVYKSRWITIFFAVSLLLVFNPLLWPIYSDFVTGGLNFRLWWGLPVPMFFALCLTYAVVRSGWHRAATAFAAIGLICLSALPTGLIGTPGTTLRFSILKIPPQSMQVVARLQQIAPENKPVLAPEDIAAWLPTQENAPQLVYARALYLWQSEPVVPDSRLSPRLTLANWINGDRQTSATDVVAAIQTLNVGLVVTPQAQDEAMEPVLRQLGAAELEAQAGYRIFLLAD